MLRALRSGWVDWLFIAGLVWLISRIVSLVRTSPSHITEWLLVYLTGVYALLTLYLALVAVKSALATERSAAASERSAAAMEASIQEARLARVAQFGAIFRFADQRRCYRNPDGSVVIRIQNPFGQPMVDFRALLWQVEQSAKGEPEVRYSTMMESEPRTILPNELQVDMVLRPAQKPESQMRALGEEALQRYKDVFQKMPEHALCLIIYSDRANIAIAPAIFVWDLEIVSTSIEEADTTASEFFKYFRESHRKKPDS